jgi:hypothetical protein
MGAVHQRDPGGGDLCQRRDGKRPSSHTKGAAKGRAGDGGGRVQAASHRSFHLGECQRGGEEELLIANVKLLIEERQPLSGGAREIIVSFS